MKFSPFSHRSVKPEEAKEGFEQIRLVLNNLDAKIPNIPDERLSKVIRHDFSNLPHVNKEDPKIAQMHGRLDLDY